jgi:hypothetical protein
MIDNQISHELHSLAANVDEPFDLAALHRRISMQSRRRAVARVGVAGAGVAAVVGGLVMVRQDRSGPADTGLAAASSSASSAPQAAATLPDCSAVLAAMPSKTPTSDTIGPNDVPKDASASAGDVPNLGFKGIVTILAVDGAQLTFRSDEPKAARETSAVATVDSATDWAAGTTHLDPPPTLQVGQQLGLATTRGSDGLDHVIFVDVSASLPSANDKPARGSQPGDSTSPDTNPSAAPATKIVVPGATLQPGPTGKGVATITSVDATSINVTLDDRWGQARTFAIDTAAVPFYAGDTHCAPGALAVGAQVGVAYHLDDSGNVVADSALLLP